MHYTLIAGEQETLGSQCGTAMSATSLRPNTGGIIAAVEVEFFGLVFSPAKPTLDMIRTMRPCLKWCDRTAPEKASSRSTRARSSGKRTRREPASRSI